MFVQLSKSLQYRDIIRCQRKVCKCLRYFENQQRSIPKYEIRQYEKCYVSQDSLKPRSDDLNETIAHWWNETKRNETCQRESQYVHSTRV